MEFKKLKIKNGDIPKNNLFKEVPSGVKEGPKYKFSILKTKRK